MTVLRVWFVGLVCWLAAATTAGAELAEKRVAFVVGNGAYTSAPICTPCRRLT